MAGLFDAQETDFLDLFLTNVAWPNIGDAAGLLPSAGPGSFFMALHTGNAITDADTAQTSNEAAYTGYGTRPGVARSVAGWTVTGDNGENDAAITYPASTSGPETETDVSMGFAATGVGVMTAWASLLADLIVNNGITPEFAIGAFDVSMD